MLAPRVEDELAYLVLACLARAGREKPAGPRGRHRQTLNQAIGIIGQCPLEALNVVDLAERVGVSRRTIEYAFNDGLGVSPVAYMKALRLGRLGRQLYKSDGNLLQVADVAIACGFRHLGQMASDYRGMFGELPSETLRHGSR